MLINNEPFTMYIHTSNIIKRRIVYGGHYSHSIHTYHRFLHVYAPPAPGHRLRCPGPRPESSYHLSRRPGDRQATRPGRLHPNNITTQSDI